ncbi:MAG: phospholipid-binding protein MlaC [Alphaproteobacteria bacterium]
MTAWLAGALALIAVPFSQQARADDAADTAGATDLIQTLGSEAVQVLKNKSETTFEQREAKFRELLTQGFDIKTISRFVIGKYWKQMSDEQKQAYNDVFVDFITRVYAARFDAYSGETFEMVQTVKDSSNDYWVRTRIHRPGGGGQPIAVDYRVRPNEGTYKVVDVVVEGISMLNTHRVEFASVADKRGIDGLIQELHARLEQPVGAAAGQTGG